MRQILNWEEKRAEWEEQHEIRCRQQLHKSPRSSITVASDNQCLQKAYVAERPLPVEMAQAQLWWVAPHLGAGARGSVGAEKPEKFGAALPAGPSERKLPNLEGRQAAQQNHASRAARPRKTESIIRLCIQ
jgi:hypothetical protein